MERALTRRLVTVAVAFGAAVVLAALPAAATSASDNVYTVTNLVSDVSGVAPNTDSNLVNAWGLTSTPGSPWWVADNETNVSTIYRASGATARAAVPVLSAPTGAVSNTTSNFVITDGTTSAPATFLFATEEGTILGFSSTVSGSQTFLAASSPGAIYKGLAIADDRLYATDFHHGRVDVFDGSFQAPTATDHSLSRSCVSRRAGASRGCGPRRCGKCARHRRGTRPRRDGRRGSAARWRAAH